MKVIDKPIQVMALFSKDGVPDPLSFWIEAKDQTIQSIKIDKVVYSEKQRGRGVLLIRCRSIINNIERTLDIEYFLETCKWVLHSIE